MGSDSLKIVILSGVKLCGKTYYPSDEVVEVPRKEALMAISHNQAKLSGSAEKSVDPPKSSGPEQKPSTKKASKKKK